MLDGSKAPSMMCPTWTVIAAILSLRAGRAPRHSARSAPPAPCLRVAAGIPPGPARVGTLQTRGPLTHVRLETDTSASKPLRVHRNYAGMAVTVQKAAGRKQRRANLSSAKRAILFSTKYVL